MTRTLLIVGAVVLAVGASALQGQTVTGSVLDAMGNPVPNVKIEIWDGDVGPDDLLDVVFTSATGTFASGVPASGHDIFVIVKWEYELVPSSFYGKSVVRLLDVGHGDPWNPTTTFTDVTSPTYNDIAVPFAMPTITMGQTQIYDDGSAGVSAHPRMVQRILAVLEYYRANKGNVPWVWSHDIDVHVSTDQTAWHAGGTIAISQTAFDKPTTLDTRRTIAAFHEVAHAIHYRHNCDSMPPAGAGCDWHNVDSEETTGCAFKEGWASYVAWSVATSQGIPDTFWQRYEDPQDLLWRGGGQGSDPGYPSGTGMDGGAFESGENVEGAVSGVLFALESRPGVGFSDALAAMMPPIGCGASAGPNDIAEFIVAYLAPLGPSGSNWVFRAISEHGIVYTRAEFTANPIAEGDPPDAAPPSNGNFKVIDGTPVARGIINAGYAAVPPVMLGIAGPGFGVNRIRLGYKTAHDDLFDCPSQFQQWPGFVPFVAGGAITADTTAFDGTPDGMGGDGDWDILLQSESTWLYVDDFLPTWSWSPLVTPCPGAAPPAGSGPADGNPAVDTDEKYLKTLRAWFELDWNPQTNPVKEGKLVVDNTSPQIVPGSFRPAP